MMKNITQSLFWGVLAAGTALFSEIIIYSFFKIDYLEMRVNAPIMMILLFAFIEEVFKYIATLKSANSLLTGKSIIVNAWIAGIGFSLLELFFFYQKVLDENLIFNIADLVKVSALHVSIFGVFGFIVATKQSVETKVSTVVILVISHALFNFLTQYTNSFARLTDILLLTLILSNIIAFFIVNKRLASQRQLPYNRLS